MKVSMSSDMQTLNQQQFNVTKSLLTKNKNILVAGCGSGKTRISGNWLLKLLNEGKISSFLIVSPYNVISESWIDFFKTHNMTSEIVFFERDKTITEKEYKAKFIICSRSNLEKLIEKRLKNPISSYFDCVIVDEVSMFKSLQSQCRKNIEKFLKYAKYQLLLTATPYSERPEDIYALFKLYDKGLTFDTSVTRFRLKYCDKHPFKDHVWNSKPDTYKDLSKIAKKHITFFNYSACDDMVKFENHYVPMPKDLKQHYLTLKKTKCLFGYGAFDAIVIQEKLNQVANGFFIGGKEIYKLSTFKMEYIKELIEKEESVLFFYNYIHELTLLKELFPSIVNFLDSPSTTKDWNERKIKHLAINPLSAGHGVNLQFGGNVCVWLSFPTSYELYHQAIMRLARIGQTKEVIVKNIIVKNTVDEKYFNSLMTKRDIQNKFFQGLTDEAIN